MGDSAKSASDSGKSEKKTHVPWTEDELAALHEGVAKYGTGKWKKIVDDEQLGPRLVQRDNLSLGNKWRALEEVKEHSEGSEPAAKKAKSDDPRSVISDHHMENMVVACVGVLNDKNGTNQTRMHKWMEAKLVQQGDTERLPPNFKKHLHEVLEKLVTEQTLVRDAAHPTLFRLPEFVEGGLPEFVKHDKHDDTRTVVSDEHLETMVVAAVASLKDKNGTNQTRMGHWLEAKLVQQGDTERLPPNFKKHLHNVLEKLVTEQTLVKEGKYLYHLPPAVEGGHTRGDEPMSPHAEVIKHLTDEKAQVHELPRKKGKAAAEHALDSAMEAVEQAERKDRQADQAVAEATKADAEADEKIKIAEEAAAAVLTT